MILVERGPASSHAPAEPARAGEPAPDVLEFPSARRLGWSLKVHYRNDERSRFRRLPGGWLYVASPTGLECFPDLAAIIDNAHFTGLPAALDALEHMRPAAFVAYDEQTEELQFGRSLDGFASLYFGGELPAIVIGESNFVVARRLGPIRFSKADEEAYCKNWSPGPEGSFLEGVTRCFAGVRYRLRPNRDSVERCLMAPDADLVDQDQAVILLRDEMRRICATYGNKRVALRLSGGVDSRVVLAGLMDAVREGMLRREQVLCVSIVCPGFSCDEDVQIRELVALCGFEWTRIELDVKTARDAQEYLDSLPVPAFPTSFLGLLCAKEAQRRGAHVILSGHGGDEIFDFDIDDVLARSLPARLRQIDLIDYLCGANTLRDRCKTLTMALLGRQVLYRLRRHLKNGELRLGTCLHRRDRRLGLARGSAYELAAQMTAAHGLMLDVPLLRMAVLERFDPVEWQHPSGWDYKAAPRTYLAAVSPSLVEVEIRKVTFDALVEALFATQSSVRMCDGVDTSLRSAYSSADAHRRWARRVQQ